MRSLLSGGSGSAVLGVALLGLALTGPAVGAEDKAPSAGAQPEADAAGVSWIDGWDNGREKAAHTGRLMLVYVHRTSPH